MKTFESVKQRIALYINLNVDVKDVLHSGFTFSDKKVDKKLNDAQKNLETEEK